MIQITPAPEITLGRNPSAQDNNNIALWQLLGRKRGIAGFKRLGKCLHPKLGRGVIEHRERKKRVKPRCSAVTTQLTQERETNQEYAQREWVDKKRKNFRQGEHQA